MSGLFEGLPLLSDMYEFLAENRTPMCQSYTFQFWERLIVAVPGSRLTDYLFLNRELQIFTQHVNQLEYDLTNIN